jgi:hypothetical protein
MKYTVLQLRHGVWLPVREYYHFPKRQCKQVQGTGGTKARYACPGCAKALTELYLIAHECDGGTEQYPKLDILRYRPNHRWRPTASFKPILFTEDAAKPKQRQQ